MEDCKNCGAPATQGLLACAYCKTQRAELKNGVSCPKCLNLNEGDNAACAHCHASLTRPCIFCGAASSVASASCHKCGEAFEGAADRKRERETMELIGKGVQLLGAMSNEQGGTGNLLEMLIAESQKSKQ